MLKKANEEEGVETFLALFHITCSANKVLSSAIPPTTLLHWKSNNHCSSSKDIFIKYCEIKSLRYTLDMTFQHNTDKNTMQHTLWVHDCSFISIILPLDEFHNNKLWANLYGCAKLLNTKDHGLLSHPPPNEASCTSTSNDLTGINHGHT